MANTTVSATRMELTRLKGRLKTATRGHKLLKDKRDELMKQFLDVVRENREIRQRVEEGLKQAHASFTVASALMSAEMLEQSLLYPKQSVELGMTTKNIMSVNVPEYHFSTAGGAAVPDDPLGDGAPVRGLAILGEEVAGGIPAIALSGTALKRFNTATPATMVTNITTWNRAAWAGRRNLPHGQPRNWARM